MATKTGLEAVRMGARSALEQQRIIAMYSGNFYKEILPAMYDASIINQERFLFLMSCKEIESSVTTRELLDLAVAWGVTPTPSEFWKTHKSRDDLVQALRRRKTELEKQALEQEQQPFLLAREAEERTLSSDGRVRRSSLVVLGSLSLGKETMGDVFGTRGEYTDGIIYMARRVRMDEQSMEAVKAKRKQTSALARAARMQARRRLASDAGEGAEGVAEVEEDEAEWEAQLESQLQEANGEGSNGNVDPNAPPESRDTSRAGHAMGDPSNLSSPLSPTGLPSFDKLNGESVDPEMKMHDGATLEDWIRNGYGEKIVVEAGEKDDELTALLEPDVMATLPLDGPIIVDGRVRVLCKDGYLHRVVAIRVKGEEEENFGSGDLDDGAASASHASAAGIDEAEVTRLNQQAPGKKGWASSASSAVGVSANEPFDFMSFVAKNDIEPDDLPTSTRAGRMNTLGMDDILLPAVDEHGVLSVAPSSGAPNGFIQSSSPRSPLPSAMSISVNGGLGSNGPASPVSGFGYNTGASSAGNNVSAFSSAVPSPTRASKIDLYYRPVTDEDRMVVVIPTRADDWKDKMRRSYHTSGGGSTSPSRRGSNSNSVISGLRDDNMARTAPLPSPYSTGGYPMSPTAMETSSPEKLAMRHRLGGKAGVLARQISGRIREDIPMRDFTRTGESGSDSPRPRSTSLSKAGAAAIKSPSSRKI